VIERALVHELFRNIEPNMIENSTTRERVRRLWTESDPRQMRSTAEDLLAQTDVLGQAAVFDLYSYANTTSGAWLSDALAGLTQTLIASARRVLDDAWSDTDVRSPHQCRLIASCMHMLWRAVMIDDAPSVLRALATESDPRVTFPAVCAAELLRGVDANFGSQVAPLLADVAARGDLPSIVRRSAIEALGIPPAANEHLVSLMQRLPIADAATAALVLLAKSPALHSAVEKAAASWSDLETPPVPLVLERLGRLVP
jgi:hypothetical protein